MANISAELQAILAAVYGEEVRGSIYSAIDKINKVSEKVIDSGTAINAGDPKGDYYDASLYINTATDELLRCNGTNWVKVGYIRGNGIDEITGPVSSGLNDVYTIKYTDGNDTTFVVHNGKGIVSVVCTDQTGLIDTYTITYNDGNTDTFEIKNGNQWRFGTEISGKNATTPTVVTLPYEVRPGDSYLNISEDAIYHCTDGAPANVASEWIYDFTITSASTGTNDYTMLINKPAVNGVTLSGNKSLDTLGIQKKLSAGDGISIANDGTISAKVDEWLMDSQTPPQPVKKPMAVGSTSVTFSAAEMADIYTNGWAVKPFFNVADDNPAPSYKKMIKNSTTGELTVYYTKVKAAQAGPLGDQCWCQLRIVK